MALWEYMNWTDEQWQVYEEATVTIKLTDLDRFVSAMELLQKGTRLNSEEKEAWRKNIPPVMRLLVDEYAKISQMVQEPVDA